MPTRQRVIAFLVTSPGDLINLVAITSVFSYPKIEGKPAYITQLLSAQSQREVRARNGLTITPCIPYSEYTGPIDTLIVVGGDEIAYTVPSEDLIRWIRKRAAQARRLVSVCVGAFSLAPTGLLDGKRVTTHWHHAAKLARQFPKLNVEKDRIFIKDGKVYTTAGVTAGIDMALAIVNGDFGHKVVASIAHTLVLYVRRSGNEAQYSTLLAQQADVNGTPMSDLPAWTRAHLTHRLNVSALAKKVAMTPRTFARQFEAHFRQTPARWVQSVRLEAACSYLTSEGLPLKAVARLTGFRDEKSLRRAFVKNLAMTPTEYRERFGMRPPVRMAVRGDRDARNETQL
jgi:transcriptional regulator GlxA family with amidase domain